MVCICFQLIYYTKIINEKKSKKKNRINLGITTEKIKTYC